MKRTSFALFSPREIAKQHWRSIPDGDRTTVHVGSYLVAACVGVPFALGLAEVGVTASAGLAAAATAMAALLFALAVQLLEQALATKPATNPKDRPNVVKDAELVRGLLGNVLYCTLWSLVAALAGGSATFVKAEVPHQVLVAITIATLVMMLVAFLLTIRRLFDLADDRLNRALELPRPDRDDARL